MTRVALAALLLCACTQSGPLEVYRGTSTGTVTVGGSASAFTRTGVAVSVTTSMTSGEDLVLGIRDVDLVATVVGASLIFNDNQTTTTTTGDTTESTTLAGGLGTLKSKTLTLSLSFTGTRTQGGVSVDTAETLMFSGERE